MPLLGMRGPQFLLFYLVLSVAVYWLVREWIGRREAAQSTPNPKLRDPYEIAYLRGGIEQLVQVAVLSLLRRGMLVAVAGQLRAADAGTFPAAVQPVETAVLDSCRTPTAASTLERTGGVMAAAERYRQSLAAKGLVPTDEMRQQRRHLARIAMAALALLAFAKFSYAILTGHSNVLFLLLLVLIVVIVFSKLAGERQTRLGRSVLTDLNTLFSRVKRSPPPLRADQHHEALLLAAVFGTYAAPGIDPAAWQRLFPARRAARNGGDGGSSCGSGCGSGCGGGGGCGGCGS